MPLASSARLLARLLGAGLVCTLAACDGGDQPLEPSAEPQVSTPAADGLGGSPSALTAALVGAKIAYESRINGNAGIWVMNGDGTGRKQLTTWSGDELAPAWSRDNRHLAFMRKRPDANQVLHWDVFLMDADGTHKHWARSTPAWFDIMDPSWSPDGKHLVTAISFDGVAQYLATLDLATGTMDWVVDNSQTVIEGGYPSYSPSGASIVYVGEHGLSVNEVYPNGDPYVLVQPSTPVTRPTWSPDGKKVAYGRAVGSNMDLYVLTRSTKGVKRLTFNAQWDGNPTWSKDGSTILFSSNRSGGSQIWSVPAAGGTQTRVAKTTSWDDAATLTF
jgi:Tol biopolymer transport system component